MSFARTILVRFDEGDPRGILFYGRLQELSHRVFEDFVVSELVDRWEDWFLAEDFIVPIRHAESTFHSPMRPGRTYQAELGVARLGGSSFEVVTRFRDPDGPDGRCCAETLVVHVFADPRRMEKIAIPSAIRQRLEAHLVRE